MNLPTGNNCKVVLLTGCTGRLGTFFLQHYKHAYTIIGVARRDPAFTKDGFEFIRGDICWEAGKIVDTVLEKYGHVDTVIHGAVSSRWVELKDKLPNEFMNELRINLIAPLELSNKILQACWIKEGAEENKKKNRSIIHMGSIAGVKLYPDSGQGAYASTKAALHTLTKHMASEYADHGIRVNALAPNSFPRLVSLERVCNAVIAYIEGTANGNITVLDTADEYVI